MSKINEKEIKRRLEAVSKFEISPEVAARDLEQTKRSLTKLTSEPQQSGQNIWRIIMKSNIAKIAAAIVIIATVLIVIHYSGGSLDGSGVVWADVLKNIKTANTVAFTLESESQNQIGTEFWEQGEVKIEGPYRLFNGISGHHFANGKSSESEIISIMDISQQNQFILIYPKTKWAYTGNNGGNDALLTYDEITKDFRNGTEEYIGRVKINGQDSVCFKVSEDDNEITIWADPDTDLPIRIERLAIDGNDKTILSNITFNIELNDELFDMTIPAGYASTNMMTDEINVPFKLTENNLIQGLAVYEKYLGKFPTWYAGGGRPEQDAREKLIDEIKQYYKPSDEESAIAILGAEFIKRLPEGSDYQYVGEDVKLDDANTPVCWWKPSESKTYRVVYGDLSIRDVEPENLPDIPWLNNN
jgi:hypothetical protein